MLETPRKRSRLYTSASTPSPNRAFFTSATVSCWSMTVAGTPRSLAKTELYVVKTSATMAYAWRIASTAVRGDGFEGPSDLWPEVVRCTFLRPKRASVVVFVARDDATVRSAIVAVGGTRDGGRLDGPRSVRRGGN